MARPARWRLVLAAAMALAVILLPHTGVRAQDVGTVTANPEAATAAAEPAATEAAPAPEVTTDTPVETPTPTPTEADTSSPSTSTTTSAESTPSNAESDNTPTDTPATATSAPSTPTSAPAETPTPTEATTSTPSTSTAVSAESTPSSTESDASENTPANTPATATSAPSTAQVASDSSATMVHAATSSQSGSSLRSGESGSSASSLSSASKSAGDLSSGTLNGSSSTKTLVIVVLGGVGLTIIMSLLFVVWRSQKREHPDLGTPTEPNTATITFPPPAMPSIVAPTAQDMSAWKASGSSFASRDLPLTESTRAKLNATTRSSTEYDLADRPSQIVSISAHGAATQTPQHIRGTNTSSEQSFSIRGYSELSVLRAGDSETSAMTNDRYSTDGYSTSDRYSTNGRYSTSSRLSSEPGRSNSGWFQVPKNLDMHRFSSTSSTASSIVARKHNPVSFINHDLTQTPTVDAPVTTDCTTSRTDVPDWYSVIESPTDNDRYTTSSLDSDNISDERASFEL